MPAFYPFCRDANTWERDTLHGCGLSRNNPEVSRPCQVLGVLTFEQWIRKYGDYTSTCGWSLREQASTPGRWFTASMQAHQMAPDRVWQINNEVVVSTWPTGVGARLPLVAFFYLGGDASELQARTKAWIDQIRYYREYGQALHIIRVDLPQVRNQPAIFTYVEADQRLDPGDQTLRADFEDAPKGSHRRVIELVG